MPPSSVDHETAGHSQFVSSGIGQAALDPQDGEVTAARWFRTDQTNDLPTPEELPSLITAAFQHLENRPVLTA